MKLTLSTLLCSSLLAALTASCANVPPQRDFNTPLPAGAQALMRVRDVAEWPDLREGWTMRGELLPALERSIGWTSREHSKQFFPIEGIDHPRALASLERFHELLQTSGDAVEFEAAVRREFALYKSVGWDGRGGGVLFTGYYTPILEGRLQGDSTFVHALYALPEDLEKGPQGAILGQRTSTGLRPYPERHVIEASGMLRGKGLELVWFSDPLDAFIAHVNGSAFVRLGDGSLARFGYAGNNGREYTSLAKELVKAGELDPNTSGLVAIRAWARANPERVQEYLHLNERYVFFTPIEGSPRGSLNLEVEPGRTLATDKSLFPRGAVTFVDTHTTGAYYIDGPRFSRFMLDQDTGGAIRTAGRADIYVGVGHEAEMVSGELRAEGQLYYLFLD
jgi:membrane-bound lytic murein transglycosylase A